MMMKTGRAMLSMWGKKPHNIFMMHGSVGTRLDYEEVATEGMALGSGKSDRLCDSRVAGKSDIKIKYCNKSGLVGDDQ